MFDKDLFLSLCDKYDVKFSDTANEPIVCEHDKKMVQHIKMDMPGFPKQGLYCYGAASFEANQVMQEQLEKLYNYENQPDWREILMSREEKLDVLVDNLITILMDDTMDNYSGQREWYEQLKDRLCYTDEDMASYCGICYDYNRDVLCSS